MWNVARRGAGMLARGAARNLGPAFARAAAGAVGRAVPGVGQALAAADVVRAGINAYRSVRSRTSRSTQAGPSRASRGTQTGKRMKYHTSGKYVGKFKKPVKVKGSMYRNKGFVHVQEVSGIVSDPDTVYIGHSTYSGALLLEMLAQSLLRKLLQKVGNTIRSVTQPIQGYQPNTGSNWKFSIERQNKATGVYQSYDYITTGNPSIYQIVGSKTENVAPLWGEFVTVLRDYATGAASDANGSDIHVNEPTRLIAYREEGNVGSFWQHAAEIRFAEEKVHFFSKSQLKVQNRTLAATGSADEDDVTNNPLEGRLIHFNGGCPRSKINDLTSYFIESMQDFSGLLLTRAAQMTSASLQELREPADPKLFWNSSKASKIKLGPGDIKKDVIYDQRSYKVLYFLKRMMAGYSLTGNPTENKQINLFGKSGLISLEDMINVNAASNISCAYEINRELGMFCTTTKNTFALGRRYQIIANNQPPT